MEVTEAAIRRFKQQQIEVERREAERDAEESARRQSALAEAARRRQCTFARHSLHVPNKQRPVYRLNAQDQEVYLSDQERADQVKIMNGIVAANCVSR